MTEQMQIDEEIAIEVLETLSNSNLDHKTNVSTTNKKGARGPCFLKV